MQNKKNLEIGYKSINYTILKNFPCKLYIIASKYKNSMYTFILTLDEWFFINHKHMINSLHICNK